MKIAIASAFLVALAGLAPARADDAGVVLCKHIVDRTAELIRAGNMVEARQRKNDLEKCLPILNEALKKSAQEVVDRYYAETARSR